MIHKSDETGLSVDQQRMQEAIRLAQESLVRTSPNPRVACIIYDVKGVKRSQGVTSPAGGPHAEVNALNDLALKGFNAQGATAYVTLEPCAHHGRTAPCANALIQAGLARVVIGVLDPNPLVSGRGVALLRAAGIEVDVGIEETSCQNLHAPFFKWIRTGHPWVTLKGAMTLDGCLATSSGDSKWITGIEARTHVHHLRAQADAILIGGETARLDRPQLNVRLTPGDDPIPVILSKELSLPRDLPCARPGGFIFTRQGVDLTRKTRWQDQGLHVVEVPLEGKGLHLPTILETLGGHGMTRILVEGGGRLHGAFLEAQLADELKVYIAAKLIGRGRPLFNLASVSSIPEGLQIDNISWTSLGDDMHLSAQIQSKASETL